MSAADADGGADDAMTRLTRDARTIVSDLTTDASAVETYGATHGATLNESDVSMLVKLFQTFSADDGDAWRRTSTSAGADVYRRASADASTRAHQVLGVTETRASADDVFEFFSAASEFDRHFGILDDMFKGGDVLSFRLYDHMLEGDARGVSMSGDGEREGKRRGFGGGFGGALRRGPRFGELFERLEKNAKSLQGEHEHAADASSSSSVSSVSTAKKPLAASSALSAVPKESPTNPLGCRPGHAILRGTFKLPSIIRDRDFVWEQLTMKMPNGAVVVAAQSIENGVVNAVAPPLEGHVRGSILVSGYYAVPNPKTGGSTLYYVVQADPKGQLPMWVVNLVAPDQAQNVARLRNHLDSK